MGPAFQGVGGAQHEQAAVHVGNGFLRHDGAGVEAVAQHHHNGGEQGHGEHQPGQQSAAAISENVYVTHTGVQHVHAAKSF